MIKCDFGKETRISGSPAQIAVELETLMRKTRFALCESLGESGGLNFSEEFIRLSKLDDRNIKSIKKCPGAATPDGHTEI